MQTCGLKTLDVGRCVELHAVAVLFVKMSLLVSARAAGDEHPYSRQVWGALRDELF
jgi:hypothetical protein